MTGGAATPTVSHKTYLSPLSPKGPRRMTNRLLTISLVSLLLVPVPASSQTELSASGGMTLSKVRFSGEGLALEADYRLGIRAGAQATMPLAGPVALQVGGAYVQKGFRFTFFEESEDVRIDYLELTALLRPVFPLGEPETALVSMAVFGGPAVGVRVGCSVKDISESCSEDVASLDLGVAVGAGLRAGRFRVDATYTLGFMNVNPEEGEDEGTITNRSLAVQAGFVIPL